MFEPLSSTLLLLIACAQCQSIRLKSYKTPYSVPQKKKQKKHVEYIIINNMMCYIMLCMLEWMRKEKHRIGTLRTQGLRGSALTAYIHRGIP